MKDPLFNDAELEKDLRSLAPASVRPEAMQAWQDALAEEAPCSQPAPRETGQILGWGGLLYRSGWRLAAAFVLMGCVIFIVLNKESRSKAEPSSVDLSHRTAGSVQPALFTELAFEPNTVENHFVGAKDDGVVGALGGVPFRRVRFQLEDAYHWENAENGSRLEMVIPREEVLLLPVVTY